MDRNGIDPDWFELAKKHFLARYKAGYESLSPGERVWLLELAEYARQLRIAFSSGEE